MKTVQRSEIVNVVRDAKFDFTSNGDVIFYTAMPPGAVTNKLRSIVEVHCERDAKVTIVTLPNDVAMSD